MKNVISALVVGFLFLSFCFAETVVIENKSIPKENQTILPPPFSAWTPNENETEQALSAIKEYLQFRKVTTNDYSKACNFSDDDDPVGIRKEFSNYFVQFTGRIINGQKIIECNFFHKTTYHPGWEKRPVGVCGGGYYYWHFNYNLALNRIEGMQINAPE